MKVRTVVGRGKKRRACLLLSYPGSDSRLTEGESGRKNEVTDGMSKNEVIVDTWCY